MQKGKVRAHNWIANSIAISCLMVMCTVQLIGQSSSVYPDVDHESNADTCLKKAQHSEGDFEKQRAYAQRAATLFQAQGREKQYIQAQLLLVQAAYYQRDSLAFVQAIEPVFEWGEARQDTAVLVEAYFQLGKFYFFLGEYQRGLQTLKQPDKRELYNAASVEDNVSILGALVDVSLGYGHDWDSAYYYTVRLQKLADKFNNPSGKVISLTKQAYLFSKAHNFEHSLTLQQQAYPYLSQVEQKGFLYYFYGRVIRNFIEIGQPDSAAYYLKELESNVTFEENDPRRCYTALLKTKVQLDLGHTDVLTPGFLDCYAYFTSSPEGRSKRDIDELDARYTMSKAHVLRKEWGKAEAEIGRLIKAALPGKDEFNLMKAYELQYEVLMAQGRNQAALEAHRKFKQYSDEVNQVVFTQGGRLLQAQLDLQHSEQENTRLEAENVNAQLTISRRNNLILLVVMSFGLMGGLAFFFRQEARQRKHQQIHLARMVEKRTAELKTLNEALLLTNKELSVSNSELERFAYVASHDLQEPLRTIMSFSSLLHKKIDQQDKTIREYLGYIDKGTMQMHHLIEDILAYSKLSKSGSPAVRVELNDVVREAEFSLQELIQKKQAVVKVAALPTVNGSRGQLVIIFKNLISNAIKYNASQVPTVTITHIETADIHEIAVEDNGIGIGQAYHEIIFDLFTRLHSKSEYEGTGIGLALVKKMVHYHGGSIQVESSLGDGTRFVFSLKKDLQVIGPEPVQTLELS